MMKRWQLALIPVLIVANYFFMVVRHESCHALVALLTGGHITAFHVWPPRGVNLSWITEAPRVRSVAEVQLQAMLPHVAGVAMVAASLFYLGGVRRMGFWQLNVVLTGVVFPLIDLGLSVGAYWFANNDYFFIFGPGTLPRAGDSDVLVSGADGSLRLRAVAPPRRRRRAREWRLGESPTPQQLPQFASSR